MTWRRSISGVASARCLNLFSLTTSPMSTIVPLAMAMPDSATLLASTPKIFMPMKLMSTASGSNPEIINELLRCMTMTMTTMAVTRISSVSAWFRVPRVS
jgi:hypothetical protein